MHKISPTILNLKRIGQIMDEGLKLELSDESRQRIQKCRQFLEQKLAESDELIYGINTGFGSLCNVRISESDLEKLQSNLVQSHACGMGDEAPAEVVRLMLLLKIQGLSQGFSAVQLSTVERLIDFFNHDVLPVVFEQGSLGASGDLAPLAHLSLPLLGLGEVRHKGKIQPSAKVLEKFGWEPLHLKSKEGLALLNGTQFCQAYGIWCLLRTKKILETADRCAALSMDGFNCRTSPFEAILHNIRPHEGQLRVARNIRKLREGSEIAESEKTSVQDPYAFRCVPQVHGASWDAVAHVEQVFTIEINSVTDNPTIFPEEDAVLSGGNFHAQPLALSLDFLAIALAEIGSISERRTYQLISGLRGLPPFLIEDSGLNSGLMIPQYTAASIVSQNKQLCTPASVDSIVSCNGQEDHVSMGANAATKALRVVKNVERLLAIEWMNAAQAIEFRRPKKTSPDFEKELKKFRKAVPKLNADRILSTDLKDTLKYLFG